jgi:hypothetical protein
VKRVEYSLHLYRDSDGWAIKNRLINYLSLRAAYRQDTSTIAESW